jgi:hypothetical protein
MLGAGLKTSSEQENESSDHDGPFATEAITGVTSEHGAKESTTCEDRHHGTAASY